jgi:hypothetical protein
MHPARNADAAGLSKRLQPSRDIDAVAEEIAPFNDDVALMHADPHLDTLTFGKGRIARQYPFLNAYGSPKRLHGARELSQQPIPDELEDAPAMLGHDRVDDALAYFPQGGECPCLVLADQPAEADHVGREDGG